MTTVSRKDNGSRAVRLPGTNNVRDLGGLPTSDGRHIRSGRLYRGESLSFPGASEVSAVFDPDETHAYRALGLSTVIDLRTTAESAATPSAWGEASGARVVALAIEEGGEGSDTNVMGRLLAREIERFTVEDLGDLYVAALERRAEVFATVVRTIADESRQPCLVHCAAGKDRTGLLVALVLAAVGVPREHIVDDYVLTGRNRPDRVLLYAPVLEPLGLDLDDVRPLFETPAEAMHRALDHIDNTYGSAGGFLRERGGIKEEELQALRACLVVQQDHRPPTERT